MRSIKPACRFASLQLIPILLVGPGELQPEKPVVPDLGLKKLWNTSARYRAARRCSRARATAGTHMQVHHLCIPIGGRCCLSGRSGIKPTGMKFPRGPFRNSFFNRGVESEACSIPVGYVPPGITVAMQCGCSCNPIEHNQETRPISYRWPDWLIESSVQPEICYFEPLRHRPETYEKEVGFLLYLSEPEDNWFLQVLNPCPGAPFPCMYSEVSKFMDYCYTLLNLLYFPDGSSPQPVFSRGRCATTGTCRETGSAGCRRHCPWPQQTGQIQQKSVDGRASRGWQDCITGTNQKPSRSRGDSISLD